MPGKEEETRQDLQAESNSESTQSPHLSESQEYSLGVDGDVGHLKESLQGYLAQLQSLQQSRFYLPDRAKDPHQFRMIEIGSSD